MKIGILTQPLHNNYGGLLQNYALQQVLKGMGHAVETVDWMAEYSKLRIFISYTKNWMMSLISKTVEKPRYKPTKEETEVLSRNTHRFIEHYLSVCPLKVVHQGDFIDVDSSRGYDAYVVGSDQVWRPKYNPFLPSMFLDFVDRKEVKRIAYAASFGTSEWEFSPQMTNECAQLARKFDLITVREKSGVKQCREHLCVEAVHVLDPTMLLNREDYEKVIYEENVPRSSGTLFHYILDPSDEKREMIDRIASQRGYIPFTIMPKCQVENRTKWDLKNRIEDCVFPSVALWLRGFMDAEMTVVDSFHGAVFSIIFNKPFWVIGNKKRGNARFESLLGLFGLENRMIESWVDIDLNASIDWGGVNSLMENEKKRCLAMLREKLLE